MATIRVSVSLDDATLIAVDEAVAAGEAHSRDGVVGIALARYLDHRQEQARIGQEIVDAYTRMPQTAEDEELAEDRHMGWEPD